jgi:predicted TIM-barrel fold metal-dependent hydrolase
MSKVTRSPLPASGVCDCHVHVIGPKTRYPLNARRSYTPADAPTSALLRMMDNLRIERAVIVQPSIYGTDNACTCDALDALGDRGRGVAVVPETISGSELDALHARGIRGVRINIVSGGAVTQDAARERLRKTAALCARNGWHVQLYLAPDLLVAFADEFRRLPAPVVFDHFAMIRPESPDEDALTAVSRLMAEGRAWTKLSGNYRVSEDAFDPAIGRLARRLHDANPDNVVWGSDWPHTPEHRGDAVADDREMPFRDMDTPRLLGEMAVWFARVEDLRRILVTNPARLYDFPVDGAG